MEYVGSTRHVRRLFIRRIGSLTADRVSMSWGMVGAAMFLAGTAIGAELDDIAIGIPFACFVVLTPFLLLAGLLYDFQTDSQSALPTFKTLLILMLVCWAALEIFALGAFAFEWSSVGRLVFLFVVSGAVALLIFSQFIKAKDQAPPIG